MRNLLYAGAMALALSALGGCVEFDNVVGAVTGSVVSPNAVYVAAQSFDIAENAAITYDKLPPCSAGVSLACRTVTGVAAVDKAVRTGYAARRALIAYVTANPGQLVPVSNYQVLETAISTIQSYAPQGAN